MMNMLLNAYIGFYRYKMYEACGIEIVLYTLYMLFCSENVVLKMTTSAVGERGGFVNTKCCC